MDTTYNYTLSRPQQDQHLYLLEEEEEKRLPKGFVVMIVFVLLFFHERLFSFSFVCVCCYFCWFPLFGTFSVSSSCCLFQHLLTVKHPSTLAVATETTLLLSQRDKRKHVARRQPCKSLQLKLHTHTHTCKKVHNKESKVCFVIDVMTCDPDVPDWKCVSGATAWWTVEHHFLKGGRTASRL